MIEMICLEVNNIANTSTYTAGARKQTSHRSAIMRSLQRHTHRSAPNIFYPDCIKHPQGKHGNNACKTDKKIAFQHGTFVPNQEHTGTYAILRVVLILRDRDNFIVLSRIKNKKFINFPKVYF